MKYSNIIVCGYYRVVCANCLKHYKAKAYPINRECDRHYNCFDCGEKKPIKGGK
jgi:hypothetical protein